MTLHSRQKLSELTICNENSAVSDICEHTECMQLDGNILIIIMLFRFACIIREMKAATNQMYLKCNTCTKCVIDQP